MNTYQICMLFVSDSKLNIILKFDIKTERIFNFFIYYFFIQNFRHPLGSHLGSSGWCCFGINISAITNQILINLISASKSNIIQKSDIKKERKF